jgi:hypothetical protein
MTTATDRRRWYPRYDPDQVGSISSNACDSAGFFQFWKDFMEERTFFALRTRKSPRRRLIGFPLLIQEIDETGDRHSQALVPTLRLP